MTKKNLLAGGLAALLLSSGATLSAETSVTHESHTSHTGHEAQSKEEHSTKKHTKAPKVPPALDALFGGPFELTDHKGNTRRDSDWDGKFKLIFFGYTNCPAICPTTLSDISDALDILGKSADEIQPIFITVDPDRDTQEVMADYVSSFYPSLVGLTGTEHQISKVAKSYRVQRHKILLSEEDHSAHTGHGGEVNYDAAHSTLTYLMDREGKFVTLFPYDTCGEIMAQRLRGYLPGSS